jgi:hypothetical protein
MSSPSFGPAWHQIEPTSKMLRHLAVPSGERDAEIARARRIVASLAASAGPALRRVPLAAAAIDGESAAQNPARAS